MEKSIVLKSGDFKFPSEIERNEASKDYLFFKSFDFSYKSGFRSVLIDHLQPKEASRIENLFWWNMCLQNRFGFLYETYINLITNYNRGFKDDLTKCSDNEYVNKILFDYFSEIFYYYFFSIRDILGQILNLFFLIGKTERHFFTNKSFLDSLTQYDSGLYKNFNISITEAKEIRDGFAHRFSPNQPDFRSNYNKILNKDSISLGGGHFISSEQIVENIRDSLKNLNILLLGLSKILIIEEK